MFEKVSSVEQVIERVSRNSGVDAGRALAGLLWTMMLEHMDLMLKRQAAEEAGDELLAETAMEILVERFEEQLAPDLESYDHPPDPPADPAEAARREMQYERDRNCSAAWTMVDHCQRIVEAAVRKLNHPNGSDLPDPHPWIHFAD